VLAKTAFSNGRQEVEGSLRSRLKSTAKDDRVSRAHPAGVDVTLLGGRLRYGKYD